MSNPEESTGPSDGRASVLLIRGLNLTRTTKLTPLSLSSSPAVQLYLLPDSNGVAELARLSTPYTSWLLRPEISASGPDIVERGGDVIFLSQVDPVFAALPMLLARREASGTSAFQPLDALLVDDANVSCCSICDPSALEVVCDVKTVMDEKYYRLNNDLVVNWLRTKVDTCAKIPGIKREDALDIVCSYISDDWAIHLRKSQLPTESGGAKDQLVQSKLDADNGHDAADGVDLAYAEMLRSARQNAVNAQDDFSDAHGKDRSHDNGKRELNGSFSTKNGASQPAQKKRKTPAQSKLAKADMRGVRSVTSFFSKKT